MQGSWHALRALRRSSLFALTKGSFFKSYYQLRVPLLARTKARLAPKLAAFLAAAKRTGCVICTDGWSDARNRSLYNFLVVTPSGAYFLMSVDTLGAEKLAAYTAEQLSR